MNEFAQTIQNIGEIHKTRKYYMDQRIRIYGALGALLRGHFGWHKKLPADEDKAIKDRVDELIAHGRWSLAKHANEEAIAIAERDGNKKPRRIPDRKAAIDPAFEELSGFILPTLIGVVPIETQEDNATKQLEALAATLPVAKWWSDNVFQKTLSLGVIIGEAGDLSNYPEQRPEKLQGRPPSKHGDAALWKRLGLAVLAGVDGEMVRQGKLPKASTKAIKELWIEHGYSGERRAHMAVIGESLLKNAATPRYKDIYDRRKEYLVARAEQQGKRIVPAKKIPKEGREQFISRKHIHLDAMRYMEKRLLRDLWRAWRRTKVHLAERPINPLSAASLPEAAE